VQIKRIPIRATKLQQAIKQMKILLNLIKAIVTESRRMNA
jgi:hypothetical protein